MEGYDGPNESILGFSLRVRQLPFEIGAFTAMSAGREPGDIALPIDVIVVSLSNLGAVDWLLAIRRWHAEGLLDPTFADLGTIDENMAPVDRTLARLRSERRGYVADAATEMSWWAMFDLPSALAASDDSEDSWSSALAARRPAEHDRVRIVREPVKQVVREQPRSAATTPCPCGSGRKFKKCPRRHLSLLPAVDFVPGPTYPPLLARHR
jgi:hypothetical protein